MKALSTAMNFSLHNSLIFVLAVVMQVPASDIRVESRAPSVQLKIERSSDDSGSISARNIGTHSIMLFSIGNFSTNSTVWNGPIKAGETISLGSTSELLFIAALLDDGSYEGDYETAVQLSEHYIGTDIQFERISKRIDATIAESTEERAVESILDELSRLSDSPDAEIIERWQHDFPALKANHSKDYILMSNGMKEVRKALLNQFESYRTHPRNTPLADNWNLARKMYEKSLLLDYRHN